MIKKASQRNSEGVASLPAPSASALSSSISILMRGVLLLLGEYDLVEGAVLLGCLSAISRLSLGYLSAVSRLSLGCRSAVARLSLGYLSAVSRLSLGYLLAGHRPVDGVSHRDPRRMPDKLVLHPRGEA